MTAAAGVSGQVDQKVDEPANLRELYARAQADLKSPAPGAHLRWIFWHAKAVGRLEVARAVLKRFETRDWEAHSRALSFMPGTPQYQAMIDARPTEDIKRAQDFVTEQASMVQAARDVAAMLAGGRR